MCPCNTARYGAFLLTLAGCMAVWSQVLFGVSVADVLRLAFAGDFSAGMWGWSALVLAGLCLLASGLHAAFTHADEIEWPSLLWSGGVIGGVIYVFTLPEFTASAHPWARPFLISWGVGNAVNLWVQLRGVFGSSDDAPLPVPQPSGPLWTQREIHIRERTVYAQGGDGSRQPPPLVYDDEGRVYELGQDGEYLPAPERQRNANPLRGKQRVR